jgi:hypothetical protein
MNDAGNTERAMRLRQKMNEYLRSRTPQERDRTMQIHLAQARGPVANALLLRQMTNFMLRIKKAQKKDSDDE